MQHIHPYQLQLQHYYRHYYPHQLSPGRYAPTYVRPAQPQWLDPQVEKYLTSTWHTGLAPVVVLLLLAGGVLWWRYQAYRDPHQSKEVKGQK